MSDEPPFLGLLLRQQKQILDEMGEFRHQLTALTAICTRIEGAVTSLTIEVRAARRVTELEAK
jgi:hypothetical protein